MSDKLRYEIPSSPLLMVKEPEAVGAYEAKTHLSRLLEEVEAGSSFLITRHGRAIARLVPVQAQPEQRPLITALRELRSGLHLGDGDIEAWKAEGRE